MNPKTATELKEIDAPGGGENKTGGAPHTNPQWLVRTPGWADAD